MAHPMPSARHVALHDRHVDMLSRGVSVPLSSQPQIVVRGCGSQPKGDPGARMKQSVWVTLAQYWSQSPATAHWWSARGVDPLATCTPAKSTQVFCEGHQVQPPVVPSREYTQYSSLDAALHGIMHLLPFGWHSAYCPGAPWPAFAHHSQRPLPSVPHAVWFSALHATLRRQSVSLAFTVGSQGSHVERCEKGPADWL